MHFSKRYRLALIEIAAGKEPAKKIAADALANQKPPKPYEYTGQFKEFLPQILRGLRNGDSIQSIKKELPKHCDNYWSDWKAPLIRYVAKRYGFHLPEKPKIDTFKRNKEIVAIRRAGGTTLHKLGEQYGLSRDRVRQIICRANREDEEEVERKDAVKSITTIKDIPINALSLSTRTRNCLFNEGILTVGQLMQLTDKTLLEIPNFGRASLQELKKYIQPANLQGLLS